MGRRRECPFPFKILEEVMLTTSLLIPLVRISLMATQEARIGKAAL